MRCQPACRRLRPVVCAGFGAGAASAARRFAEPRLLAAQQAADVGAVAKDDRRRQLRLPRLARQPVREPAGALRLQQRPEGDRRAARAAAIRTNPAASATDRLNTDRTPNAVATPCRASDSREAEWRPVAPDRPARKPPGRRRSTDLREAVDAALYVLRSGCIRKTHYFRRNRLTPR